MYTKSTNLDFFSFRWNIRVRWNNLNQKSGFQKILWMSVASYLIVQTYQPTLAKRLPLPSCKNQFLMFYKHDSRHIDKMFVKSTPFYLYDLVYKPFPINVVF